MMLKGESLRAKEITLSETCCEKKLILIVGLQKSGTTLLLRLLQHTELVENPFNGEGHDFWGNVPHFTPCEFPAGLVYQQYQGKMGHEIGAKDASFVIQATLHKRLRLLKTRKSLIVNKNPFNTVRLPWIRKLFPDAFIVAMVRKPVPNVFSLLKKFTPHKGTGSPPEDGWWGVKPRGWRNLVHQDKVIQCARQWQTVNARLWNDRDLVDLIVNYQQLCMHPATIVQQIITDVMKREFETPIEFPPLKCFDDEYTRGSRLRSKNKYFKETGTLITPDKEVIEMPSLQESEVAKIREICGATTVLLEVEA